MTDLLRWGSAVFPEHRSFGALAKSGIGFVLTRRRLAASCAAAAIGVAALTYCAVGYVHFKRLAGAERATAERTERANAELQDAMAGLRDQLAAAQARIDTLSEEAKRQLAVSETAKADRIAQLTRALDQAQRDLHLAEAQRATLAARLSKDATDLADGQQKQSQAQSSLDQTQKKLQQLTTLDLSYNSLTELPVWLGRLRSLEYLYASNNDLRDLPASVGELEALRYLNVAYNELTQLPDGAMEEVGMVHHQGHAVAFGKRHQLLPLCYAGAHRLFDKDMLVLHKRAARESKVGGGGGGDHHSLDLRVVDQLRGVGI